MKLSEVEPALLKIAQRHCDYDGNISFNGSLDGHETLADDAERLFSIANRLYRVGDIFMSKLHAEKCTCIACATFKSKFYQ